MIDLSLLILSIGVTTALVFFSVSSSYRIISETLLKRKSPSEKKRAPEEDDQDRLMKKLEEYQRQTYARPFDVQSERTRMIADRIRREKEAGLGS